MRPLLLFLILALLAGVGRSTSLAPAGRLLLFAHIPYTIHIGRVQQLQHQKARCRPYDRRSVERYKEEAILIRANARSLPQWLAPVVEGLELERARIVTVGEVQRLLAKDRRIVWLAISDLVKRGWLRPVGIRGTYEFIPGAAAGPYSCGDPWLVLRAVLANRAGEFHVGVSSAAWLLGFAQRMPERHFIVAQSGTRAPRALHVAYEVLTTNPAPASNVVDGLPVPTRAELFAEVAQLAPRLELDSTKGWLRRLLDDTKPSELSVVLSSRSVATRARAGYLAEVCGAKEHADAISAIGPLGRGPYYMQGKNGRKHFSPRWRLYGDGKTA